MALDNLAKMDTLADRVLTEIVTALARRRQTQAALARALGVPPMWVSDRLSGKTQLAINDLDRIASALGVTVLDLFPRRDREVTVTNPQVPVSAPFGEHRRPRPPVPSQRPGDRRPPSGPGHSRPAAFAHGLN